MSRTIRWLLALTLLLWGIETPAGASRTSDYYWLLFLDGNTNTPPEPPEPPPQQNNPPQVDAGADKQLTYPSLSVILSATVSDDHDANNALSYSWSKVSGPGSVSFNGPKAVDTVVDFGSSGIYNLQLSVTDSSQASSADQVKVTVDNNPPNVDAGTDVTTTSSSASLQGRVTDGTSAGLSYHWTQVSGPGSASFTNPFSEKTEVTLPKVGTYVFELEGDDSDMTATDTVTVERLPEPVINKVEVMRALGDSMTEGIGDGDGTGGSSCRYDSSGKYIMDSCDGYPPKLHGLLNNKGRFADGFIFWENAIGGRTTAQAIDGSDGFFTVRTIVNRTTTYNGTAKKADLVVVLFGANDSCSAVSPDEFESNMRTIINEIKAVGAEPVLMKVPYARKDGAGATTCFSNSLNRSYNTRIQSLANNDASIKVVPPDLYSWFKNNTNEIWGMRRSKTDFVHPTTNGYWSMARMLRDNML